MIREIVEKKIVEQSRKRDVSLYNVEHMEESLAMQYAMNSKFSELRIKKLSKRTANFYNPFVLNKAAQPFKIYKGKQIISLEGYGDPPLKRDLFETLGSRKSTKNYSKQNLSLRELFYLLRYSNGINRRENIQHGDEKVPWSFRPIPSPGGLFASEIYLVMLNGQIEKGIYHYRPDINALEFIKPGDYTLDMKLYAGVEPYINTVEDVGCVLVISSMLERLYIKYGERAYRFMLLEVGFLAQSISLIAQALGLGSCMLGGYYDDEINDLIGLDGIFETVQNVMVIGNKQNG